MDAYILTRRAWLRLCGTTGAACWFGGAMRTRETLVPAKTAVDHLLLGVADLDHGIAWVERITAVKAIIILTKHEDIVGVLGDPLPNQRRVPYWFTEERPVSLRSSIFRAALAAAIGIVLVIWWAAAARARPTAAARTSASAASSRPRRKVRLRANPSPKEHRQ